MAIAKNDGAWQTRPLYSPEPLLVREDSSGSPVRVGEGRRTVIAIEDKWRIDDEWWRREPVSRMYYAVILDNGQRQVIYKDLVNGHWYRQRHEMP